MPMLDHDTGTDSPRAAVFLWTSSVMTLPEAEEVPEEARGCEADTGELVGEFAFILNGDAFAS